MRCKYNISYKVSSQEETDEIARLLKNMGYRVEDWSTKFTPKVPYFIADNLLTGARALLNEVVGERELIEDKEAFLAIAAQREDDTLHEGEWVYITGEGHTKNNEFFPKGELFKVQMIDKNSAYPDPLSNTEVTGTATAIGKEIRKATIEEIIEHFNKQKPKQQTSMKQDFTVRGTKNLVQAFVNELVENGIPTSDAFNNNKIPTSIENPVVHPSTGGPKRIFLYQSGHEKMYGISYNLPEDWNKALEAFKNYWKETPEEMAKRANISLNSPVSILEGRPFRGINTIDSFDHEFFVSKHSISRFAEGKDGTPIVIVKFYDKESWEFSIQDFIDNPIPKEKTIKVKYQDGELEFTVGESKISIKGECANQSHSYIEKEIKNLQKLIDAPILKIFGYNISYSTIDIGCKKGVDIKSLQEVIAAYKEFNP